MKKISKPSGNIRLAGKSLVDGVSIQASRLASNGRLEKMPIQTVARVDQDKSIYCDMVRVLEHDTNTKAVIEKLKIMKRKLQKYGLIAAAILFVISFAMIFVNINISNFTTGLMYLSWGVCGSSANLAYLYYKVKKDGDILSLMRFHAAEHAVINGYYDLGRTPTMKEIKNYSSFSRGCGSLEQSFNIVIFGLLAIVRFLTTGWLFVVLAVLTIALTIVLYKTGHFYFAEVMILEEPSDLEYEVAIKALETELANVMLNEHKQNC